MGEDVKYLLKISAVPQNLVLQINSKHYIEEEYIMKIKTIAASVALIALGSVGSALAGQGENTLNFTLNADVTKATPGDNVQIRLYNQNNLLPSANLNINLQEALDTEGNIVWGTTGNFMEYGSGHPQISPENIYVAEIYSKNGTANYNGLSTECQDISLQNAGDAQNVLTATCDRIVDNKTAYVGVKEQVPQDLQTLVSQPQYVGPSLDTTYTMSATPVQGDSLYIPLAFYAHLPSWGDDLSAYTPGTYTASGSMIIKASWV